MAVAASTASTSGSKQLDVPLADDVVDQVLGGIRQHQSGERLIDHQHEAQGQQSAAGPHQRPDVGQQCPQTLGLREASLFLSEDKLGPYSYFTRGRASRADSARLVIRR